MTFSVPDFEACRILVAGDLMLDRYWFGPTGRISPEAPVPVVRIEGREDRPGGAANVAVNLAALGVQAALAGVVGRDEAGESLRALLARHGIRDRIYANDGQPTTTKLRVLSRNQQLIRLDTEEAGPPGDPQGLLRGFEEVLADTDVVILSDYGKGTLANSQDFIAACRAQKKPVFVDPKGTDFERYRGATILTPNQSEFEAVVGECRDDETLVERGIRLRGEFDLGALLITRSARGMTLIDGDDTAYHLPAAAREVFDVTGAGDTVIAALAAAYAAGLAFADCAALANVAAGLVVAKLGVATVTRSELRQALHRRGIGGRGMLSPARVAEFVRESQERGERVVMTNGCFDLLHAGHIAYLEEAKSLGDRLVVAVNDDDSVRRLKGAGRPITPLADRLAVLAGLAAVDWVVAFAEDTPADLIRAISPNVLVKGGDYKIADIAGAEWVIANGGDVQVLCFRPGRSTSNIIAAIRNS